MSANTGINVTVIRRDGSQEALVSESSQKTLMNLLYDEDQGIEAVCGGCASCATCHVLISEDWAEKLPERGEVEDMLLQYQEHFDQGRSRLSCQIDLNADLDGLVVEIAPEE
jgi:2Fe-2S ferredoxin